MAERDLFGETMPHAVASASCFRWVGAKGHVAPRVVPIILDRLVDGGKLVSLFFGSGAIELSCARLGDRRVGADANPELRFFYESLRCERADDTWWALKDLDHVSGRAHATTEDERVAAYIRVRSMDVGPQNISTRGARFLWLQQFCFNGLWRENAAGQHNVPPARDRLARGLIVTMEDLKRTREALGSLHLLSDWTLALARAEPGDVLMADPPYLKTFEKYVGRGFGPEDHANLSKALREASGRGISVIGFNSPEAASLYEGWAEIESIPRSGRISSKGSGRQAKAELLITAGPLRVRRAA
jgi:DNA adenine methylase